MFDDDNFLKIFLGTLYVSVVILMLTLVIIVAIAIFSPNKLKTTVTIETNEVTNMMEGEKQ